VSRIRTIARRASSLLLAVGVLILAYAAYVVVDEKLYQARALKRLERGKQLTEMAGPPADGTPIGQIQIHRLGVSVVVVQGESEAILRRAVGHLARTALPGQEGNVVLAGHRDTFFRPLKGIVAGDHITMSTPDHDFEYVVESTSIVEPTDVRVIEPSGGHTLTLISCFPFYFVGPAPNRFIVFARQAE
jgi:sortase A